MAEQTSILTEDMSLGGQVNIVELLEPAPSVSPAMIIRDVKDIMGDEKEQPIGAIVVVENRKPVGLVMSLHLDRALSHQYGVSLYHKKPISSVMDSNPVIVEGDTELEEVSSKAMSRDKTHIYDHIIVTERGDYKGIVTVQRLLETLVILRNKRTQELAELNVQLGGAKRKTEKMNTELKEAYERLQEVDKMKTDFLSVVSHELRTPLTSILGFAEIVQLKFKSTIFPKLDPEEKKIAKAIASVEKNLGVILAEGDRLTTLINELLDIAKLEAGKVAWKRESIHVADLIERSIAATSSLFDKKNIPLKKHIEQDLPEFTGDKDRYIQVVINLISNAVKFTNEGGVTIKSYMKVSEIVVEVIDTGTGIAEDDKDKVFEKFKQVGDTLTSKPTGTGLGLPICKQIVEHHGGRIGVDSELGKGSTFWFTVPTGDAAGVQPFLVSPDYVGDTLKRFADNPSRDVIVMTWEPHLRDALVDTLQEREYIARETIDVMETLDVARRFTPRAILLDVHQDVDKVLRWAWQITASPDCQATPVFLLSWSGDRSSGYMVHLDRYLKTPIKKSEFLKEIEEATAILKEDGPLLVSASNPKAVKVFSRFLEDRGFAVEQALSHEQTVAKALEKAPSCIITAADALTNGSVPDALRFEHGVKNVHFVLLGEDGRKG